VDLLILFPLAMACAWLQGFDKYIAFAVIIPSTVLFAMYHVYFNARYGGTPGKLAVGIRITRPDGTPIAWKEAWLRSSVDLVFAVISLTVGVVALSRADNSTYSALAFAERMKFLRGLYPDWYPATHTLAQIWTWSELLVLLFNKRKRALHDFIAGTVVVDKYFVKQSDDPRSIWPYSA
jgi:uncharacterized RDD family membrane protein YckC